VYSSGIVTRNPPNRSGGNMELSCRREAARCFVSLNRPISISHSRSFEMTSWERLILIFHCNYVMYLVPFPRYSTWNNGLALKSVFEVVQCHWNWYHLKVLPSTVTVTLGLSCIISGIKRDVSRKSRFCSRRPRYGEGSHRNIVIPLGAEKLVWSGYSTVKKAWGYV